MASRAHIRFLGLSGYQYPHTRVRCYRFAEVLASHGYRTQVFSFHDRLAPSVPEAAMYALRDVERLRLILLAVVRLARRPGALLYVQKLHYHAMAALLMHRLFGTPFVLDYDDWEVGYDPYGVPMFCGFRDPRITRALFGSGDPERILRRVARQARFVVCASRFLEERLAHMVTRVAYVPTGVDTTRFVASSQPHDGLVIVWNGVVWGEMIRDNVLVLIRALPAVLHVRPDAKVRIIGQGDRMVDVHRAVADMGLLPHVEFPGWVDPDDMPGELARADIGVLPVAHDDPWSRGKSPTKLFEYMAAGLASVVMGGGEAALVVEHGVNGLVATDEGDFAAHLLTAASNDDLRRSLGRAARTRIEERFAMTVLGATLAREIARNWR
jgi:glycosyltransferase involved in cell wall biosynthesis